MNTFNKYQHVEKLGTTETDGLVSLTDPCYVFPKIDGTNASVWMEDGELCFGSRNRKLSLEQDNAGFMAANINNPSLEEYFKQFPRNTLYGEWLVPHTEKRYQDDSWRKFYVFDVCICEGDQITYVKYDIYKEALELFGIEYVPCIAIVERATVDQLEKIMGSNGYLMQQNAVGEGIVIKRYDFVNRYGRTTWAKMVRSEFKSKHVKTMGPAVFQATAMIEEKIADEYITQSMVDKVYAKIVNENDGWSSTYIPRLLQTVSYDLIKEESWNFVKKHRNPKIDFGALQKFTIAKIKSLKQELF